MTSDEKPGDRGEELPADDSVLDDTTNSETERADEADPVDPSRPPTDGVPTITGLFDVPEDAGTDEPDDVDADSDADVPPQTESVRIFAEMFSGFRRKSATPERDLQEILGTATQAMPIIEEKPSPQEPPPTAGAIPIVASGSTDDALTRPAAPNDETVQEDDDVTTPRDEQSTVTTAYVPHEDGNRTEQALAWLTAENVATGQTPVVGAASALVPRRRRRWVAAIVAPFFTAIFLAVVYVVAFAVWPLDNVAPSVSKGEVSAPVGPTMEVPWPEEGQAAILAEATDDVLASADEGTQLDPGPMASLTKVITVMTLLDAQPLELGADGPAYEFGYLDQQQADNLRFQNESALDVPIGGQLTYRQLLEGILMGSAGNYANKLVDDIWEFDRDSYLSDALTWLQENGLDDTLVVDATGISPDNQSTADDMVRIAQLAMQHPVVAEIVAQEEVELPGAGEVENSNPLLGELGIVGIKTGHLDEWDVTSYNLMTAKDIEIGADEPVRIYAAVMGQLDEDMQAQTSRDVLDAVTEALQPVEAVDEGTVVGTVTAPWGAETDVVVDDTAALSLWSGESAEVSVDFDVELGDTEGDEVGTATITGLLDEVEVELVTSGDLPRPSLEWRLTHPLELLGLGA